MSEKRADEAGRASDDPTMPVSYWLDAENRIEQVSRGAWDRFAAENSGRELAGGAVIGRPLLEFISGDTTRMWVHALISYARLLGKEVSRDYRCDSPTERRYMRMDIAPLDQGRLRVDNWTLRTESIGGYLDFVTAGDLEPTHLHRCSICNNLRIRDFWVEPHPAVVEQEAGRQAAVPVVYTVCPECQKAVQETPAIVDT